MPPLLTAGGAGRVASGLRSPIQHGCPLASPGPLSAGLRRAIADQRRPRSELTRAREAGLPPRVPPKRCVAGLAAPHAAGCGAAAVR